MTGRRSGLEQLALARFVGSGQLDRHPRRARLTYRARRDALVLGYAALSEPAIHSGIGVLADAVVDAINQKAMS